MKILLFLVFLATCLYIARRITRPKSAYTHTPPTPKLDDIRQACDILGLNQDQLTREQVIQSHKRLMQHVHPDKGGSVVLAQQLNEAKRVLLAHLSNQE